MRTGADRADGECAGEPGPGQSKGKRAAEAAEKAGKRAAQELLHRRQRGLQKLQKETERMEESGAGSFYTIRTAGHGEYEEKRSRFLGEAIPVRSAREAASHLERIRKEHYAARHHCSAYVLGQRCEVKKASDDGEPSGTAGLPILKVIEGRACTDTLIVVTRYFGGTLLGTGGLVRAYTAAAQRALGNADVVCMRAGEILELRVEYSYLSPVQYWLERESIRTDAVEYADRAVLRVVAPADRCRTVREKMLALSGGRIEVVTAEKGFYAFDS